MVQICNLFPRVITLRVNQALVARLSVRFTSRLIDEICITNHIYNTLNSFYFAIDILIQFSIFLYLFVNTFSYFLLLFSNLFHISLLNYEITFPVGLLEYSSSVYIHFLVSKAKVGNSLCKMVVAYPDHMYFIFDTND